MKKEEGTAVSAVPFSFSVFAIRLLTLRKMLVTKASIRGPGFDWVSGVGGVSCLGGNSLETSTPSSVNLVLICSRERQACSGIQGKSHPSHPIDVPTLNPQAAIHESKRRHPPLDAHKTKSRFRDRIRRCLKLERSRAEFSKPIFNLVK